jgi:hypothetical protein
MSLWTEGYRLALGDLVSLGHTRGLPPLSPAWQGLIDDLIDDALDIEAQQERRMQRRRLRAKQEAEREPHLGLEARSD